MVDSSGSGGGCGGVEVWAKYAGSDEMFHKFRKDVKAGRGGTTASSTNLEKGSISGDGLCDSPIGLFFCL